LARSIAPRENFFFRENGANGCRVPVGSRGCRSHSSTNTECACSHGGEVFILRKRDIDRNGGRVLYRLRDSWRGRYSEDAMHLTPMHAWWQIFTYRSRPVDACFYCPYSVIGQIIYACIGVNFYR